MLPEGFPEEEPFDLEQAAAYLNFKSAIIRVDGQRVTSYEDLVKLASQEKYRHREYLEAVMVATISGG